MCLAEVGLARFLGREATRNGVNTKRRTISVQMSEEEPTNTD